MTSSIVVKFPGGKRVDAVAGDFVVHTDQSKEHGGEASAPEPFSLFLASLASCAGLYVLAFCQARDISTKGLTLVQDVELDQQGMLERVRLTIMLPRTFPAKYVASVRAAAFGCRVKKTLAAPPEIIIESQVADDETAHPG